MNTNQEVAQKLATAVNYYFDPKGAAEYMTLEHRTLQQTFTRVCVEWIKVLSAAKYCDARNEASVQLAKDLMAIPEVKELLDNASLPLI